MKRPRLLSRENLARDLRTAVVAVLVSSVVVATPSVAARIKNADKVDGKHAVGAAAPVAKRKGKLVATNSRGRLPDNIIAKAPDADRLDGLDSAALVPDVLPRGQVMTGGFSAWGGGAGSYLSDVVNFRSRLPAAIPLSRTTIVPDNQPFTAECPGFGQVVPVGWMCLYEVNADSRTTYPPFDGTVSPTVDGIGRTGFHLYFSCTGSACYSYGGWAVRSGAPSDLPERRAPRSGPIPAG